MHKINKILGLILILSFNNSFAENRVTSKAKLSSNVLMQKNENYCGIGIYFKIVQDTLIVDSLVYGGPAYKVGLQAKDKILIIDNKNVAGINLTDADVVNKLRGKKGTTVNIDVKRGNSDKLLHFNILRDIVSYNRKQKNTQSADYWTNFEVWGVDDSKKKELMQKIIDNYHGKFYGVITDQDVKNIGYPNGEVFYAGINTRIISVRKTPDYRVYIPDSKYPKPNIKILNRWRDFNNEFSKYSSDIQDYAIIFANKSESMFANKKIDKNIEADVNNATKLYLTYVKQSSKDEIIALLAHVEDFDELRKTVKVSALYFINNEKDVLDFLPLLLVPESTMMYDIFRVKIKVFPKLIQSWQPKIKWENNSQLLTDLLNHPNPKRVDIVLYLAPKIGNMDKYIEQTPKTEFITLKDIMSSKFGDKKEKEKLKNRFFNNK